MHHAMERNLNGDQALERLMTGNTRFVTSGLRHPHQTNERRFELRDGQRPFAVILGCADSRVPPEVIFDQGLGDLFIVRVAGNIIDAVILGSIEYAASHLHTPLIMVLGHSQCGAVTAALFNENLEGNLSILAAAIRPALEYLNDRSGDIVNDTAKANARMVSGQLKEASPILSELVKEGKIKIVAAFYDLNTGAVEILS